MGWVGTRGGGRGAVPDVKTKAPRKPPAVVLVVGQWLAWSETYCDVHVEAARKTLHKWKKRREICREPKPPNADSVVTQAFSNDVPTMLAPHTTLFGLIANDGSCEMRGYSSSSPGTASARWWLGGQIMRGA